MLCRLQLNHTTSHGLDKLQGDQLCLFSTPDMYLPTLIWTTDGMPICLFSLHTSRNKLASSTMRQKLSNLPYLPHFSHFRHLPRLPCLSYLPCLPCLPCLPHSPYFPHLPLRQDNICLICLICLICYNELIIPHTAKDLYDRVTIKVTLTGTWKCG